MSPFALFLQRVRDLADRGIGYVTVSDYSPPAHEKRKPYRHATLHIMKNAATHLIEVAQILAEVKEGHLSFYGRDSTLSTSMSRHLTDEECATMNEGTYREVA